jgi:hypothetical protein
MRIDFISEGAYGCPLLRLTDFTDLEASRLRFAAEALGSGQAARIDVASIPQLALLGDHQLALRGEAADRGILQVSPDRFEAVFSPAVWRDIAGLLEPFTTGSSGYQWLATEPGPIALLITSDGKW